MSRAYFVTYSLYGSPRYLRLAGPFCYPEWTPNAAEATPLTGNMASSWAMAVEGKEEKKGVTMVEVEKAVRGV